MNNWLWILIIGGGSLLISLLFEDSRDAIVEGFEYFISFEWIGDVFEFFGGMFEDIGEFSPAGLVFAILTVGLVWMLRDYMLLPFLNHMGLVEFYFWGAVTYIGCFVMGYFIGRRLWEE